MSDISTTLSMEGGQLFSSNELITCSIFNLKMFLFVLMIIICISFLSNCLSSLFSPLDYDKQYKITNRFGAEYFGNDDFFSYKDTINPGYFTYQTADLTSNTNNLIFGQAKRYVHPDIKTSKPIYILDIFANLYVLNGNPFGVQKVGIEDTSFKHKYIAYLVNTKSGKKENIGQLIRDGDGIYKLKFKSVDINEYVPFNEIEVVHKSPQKETVILNGKFTIL